MRLDLQVDFPRRSVSGTCALTLRSFGRLPELSFDACSLQVRRVKVRGKGARFTQKDGKLRVRVPGKAAQPAEELEVEFRYRVRRPVAGLHFVKPDREHGPQLWSQGQPEDSRFWFPCHDAPHEKATSEVIARVPKGFTAVSNGVLVARESKRGGEVFHWRMDRPHALYLVSLAVGRFGETRERWGDVDVLYFCEKGREADARRGFAKTVAAMDFFSKKLGIPYPYPKYAQVAVAEFPGGMENTTATTQTDACLIPADAALDNDMDSLVAHELAHQWFGNLVTCRDWSHAWLNEGFATYFEVLFQEHDKGQDEADYELFKCRQSYFSEDEGRYRRPLVHNAYKYPWVLFDRHLYEKGACVLHMLRRELGDERWWASVRRYLESHKDGSVETPDLATAIGEATGVNIRPFFDQWVHRAGYPSLLADYRYDPKSGEATVRLLQKGSDSAGVYTLALPFECSGWTAGRRRWTKSMTLRLEGKEREFKLKVPGAPDLVELDPRGLLLKKIETRKPSALWAFQLRHGSCAMSRIQAARNVAHWGDEAAVSQLERALKEERFWGAGVEIAHALGGIRTHAAFLALARCVRHKNPKVRRAVVQALAPFGYPELAKAWKRLMRTDPSLHVRAESARALGALRDPAHLPALRALLERRSYWDILASGAVGGLAATRHPLAFPALLAACRPGRRYPVRAHALRALGGFAAARPDAVPALCGLLEDILRDGDERLALAAISALGSTGDARALPALRAARGHADSRIKTYAEEALARIQGESDLLAK